MEVVKLLENSLAVSRMKQYFFTKIQLPEIRTVYEVQGNIVLKGNGRVKKMRVLEVGEQIRAREISGKMIAGKIEVINKNTLILVRNNERYLVKKAELEEKGYCIAQYDKDRKIYYN